MDEHNCDALVVGAGPTGLTMALELARHGLRPRIIDKAPQPSQTSKALGVHARTMEYFERVGLAQRAMTEGRILHGGSIYSQRQRIVHLNFDQLESRYNFIVILPQSLTEKLLAEKLADFGISVERNVELTGFHQQAADIDAMLRHADGREEVLRAPWLIGCDGAHSQVRHELNMPFHGRAFEETFSLADVRLEANLPDDEMTVFLSSGDIVALFPMPGERRFRVIVERHEGPPVAGQPTLDDFQRSLDEHAPVATHVSDAVWMSHFRISQRQVEHYRRGRVFLAGDAAHIHSPVGGQGMNTGIQDAVNLGWKLSLVQNGHADESLLDSYDEERRPIGRRLLQATGAMSQVILLRHPVADKLRDWTASLVTSLDVVQDKIRKSMSELSIHYRSSSIVTEHRPGDWRTALTSLWDSGPRAGDRAPDAAGLRTADGKQRRCFDLLAGKGHVMLFFAARADDEAAARARQQRIRQLAQRYHGLVEQYTVLPPDGQAACSTHDSSTLMDTAGELHRNYSVRDETLLIVRPDGYLAYRGEPADADKIEAYLLSLFAPHAAGSEAR